MISFRTFLAFIVLTSSSVSASTILLDNPLQGEKMQSDTATKPKQDVWVELAGYGSTSSRTPFWMHANQWGIVPISGQIGSLRGGIETRKSLTNDTSAIPKWSFAYGLEVVANASAHSKLLIPQAYAGIAFRSFQFTVGRRKQYVGFNDHELGTGAYMWSGNALPIPRI